MYSFYKFKTTINSVHLDTMSSFVTSGVYSFTRNPMYLGLLFVLIAWCLLLSNLITVLFIPLYVLYMNYYQIKPEEEALEAKFGQAFVAYKEKTRRWL